MKLQPRSETINPNKTSKPHESNLDRRSVKHSPINIKMCTFMDNIPIHYFFIDYTCAKAVATGTTSLLASVVFPEGKNEETLSLLKTLDKRVGVKGIGAVLEGIHAEVNERVLFAKDLYGQHLPYPTLVMPRGTHVLSYYCQHRFRSSESMRPLENRFPC